MKYLIFSDTHLTPHFDERKYNVLKSAIDAADRVVINGDFWEGFAYTFDAFVKSKWSTSLFPLLKKKKAVYLYGNHDKEKSADKRVSLFSDSQDHMFKFKSGNNTFIVEHGDRLILLPDITFLTLAVLETIEDIAVKLFGARLFTAIAYSWMNRKIKKMIRGKYKKNEILITGHTHCAEISLSEQYINTGFNKHRVSQCIYIENGAVSAVTKRY